MCIKMIVTDLDGTLLRSDKELSEKNIQALRQCQQQGIRIAIATARFWIGAEKYIEILHPDYAITTDGTMAHQKNEMIYDCGFDASTTNHLIQMILETDPDTEIMAAAGKKVYWNSQHISESKKLHKAIYHDYRNPLPEAAHKIVATLPDRNTAEDIAFKTRSKVIGYRSENLYGFIHEQAGKLQAIQNLAGKLGITMEEIAAFGDDNNDIEMLKACGLGIAVSNALPSVMEIADKVTLSNDEDGVADFIVQKLLT